MREITRRDDDRLGAAGQRRQRIDGKGILGEDRRASRREKHAGDQIEHVVRAVAEHDALAAEAAALGKGVFESKVVRVARQVVDRCEDCRTRLRTHAERIFVGGELDDLLDGNPHLARELGDRLARLVGRDRPDIR
jgi:hypothetical protein